MKRERVRERWKERKRGLPIVQSLKNTNDKEYISILRNIGGISHIKTIF